MGKKKYLERELQSEKGQMKRKLWNWGQALEQCSWKQDELRKLTVLREMQRRIWGGQHATGVKDRFGEMEQEYEGEVKRLQEEMEEILQEKKRIDEMLKGLTMDEETFVRMRFEKGYGFDFIAMKMHLSRATVFRVQERALQKLITAEKKIETP